MKTCFLFLLIFTTSFCFGQVQTYFVSPVDTDINYSSEEDSSAISRNAGFQTNKLFLFMGGTNSSSSAEYNAIRLHAANLGFDFINLSYPNGVAAVSQANSSDSLAFNKYRQELCFGTPVSDAVDVDSLNSIYTRTLKLVQYLSQTYPEQNWGQYLSALDELDWSKIIVGGHSQGSGHAAYLAKKFLVDRVLMFSGPNDYSITFSNSANWLREPGITPPTRHFAYLSLNDEIVSFYKQFANISGLEMLMNDDTTYVDNTSAPYGNSKCLYTTQSPGIVILDHNVPIKLSSINQEVWTYMLTTDIATGLENDHEVNDIKIYPNPAKDLIYLTFESPQSQLMYSIYSLSGQLIKHETLIQQGREYAIDISKLQSGAYVLEVNGVARKIMKE